MFAMEQKNVAMELKMFLQQNYGIELPDVTVYGRVWYSLILNAVL